MTNLCDCGFKAIFDSKALTKKDETFMKSLKDEITRINEVNQRNRTIIEMKYSVLKNLRFPNESAKYYQAVREQFQQARGIMANAMQLETELAEKELLEAELEEIDTKTKIGKAKARIKTAEIVHKEFIIEGTKETMHASVREVKNWETIKKDLLKKDPKIIIDDCVSHQKETYRERWERETNPHSKANLETLNQDE